MHPSLHTLHVTLTPSFRGGGVSAFVWRLSEHLTRLGMQSTIAGLWDDEVDATAARATAPVRLIAERAMGPGSLGYSPRLFAAIHEVAGQAGVIHQHGLRSLLGYCARRAAVREGRPLVVSPHGQLDPWLLGQRVVRKAVVDGLWERRNLRSAAVVHAVSPYELADFRRYGLGGRLALIPPGFDANVSIARGDAAAADRVRQRWPALNDRRLLLYLSGLFPRKGLNVLADVWGRTAASHPDWILGIGGIEIDGYRKQIEAMIEAGDVADRTVFLGPVSAAEKADLLATAQMLVLPTFSEAFAIIVAEALAAGCPVMTTTAAPWPELRTFGCGWWVDYRTGSPLEALQAGLMDALGHSPDELTVMGQRGRQLMMRLGGWERTAQQMRELYLWLTHAGERPGFVYDAGGVLPDSLAAAYGWEPVDTVNRT